MDLLNLSKSHLVEPIEVRHVPLLILLDELNKSQERSNPTADQSLPLSLRSEAVGRANLHPPTVPSHPSTQPHSASSSREIRLLLDLDAGKASVLLDADIYHRNQHILRVSLRSRHKRRTSSKDVRKLTHSQTTSSSSLPQEQPSRLPEYPTR